MTPRKIAAAFFLTPRFTKLFTSGRKFAKLFNKEKVVSVSRSKVAWVKPAILLHDRDVKFTARFTKTLEKAGMKSNPLPITSPNLNGRVEKFIRTIKSECLSRFIVFGRKHLDYLISSFTHYYNHHRSHTLRGHLPPIREVPLDVLSLHVDQVMVGSFVGGLVKSFERKAA